MISNDVHNFEVQIPYGHQVISNRMVWHSENSYEFLKSVYNKEIPMFSDAYSILANTMERLYKGIAIELQKLNPNDNFGIMDKRFNTDHNFDFYVRKVAKYIPLATDKKALQSLFDNNRRIQSGYTDSKFYNEYEYKDFEVDFLRYEKQRERLCKALEQEIIKSKYKDVMEFEDMEDISDLDLLDEL